MKDPTGNRFCTLHTPLETQPSSLISGEISCKCRHALQVSCDLSNFILDLCYHPLRLGGRCVFGSEMALCWLGALQLGQEARQNGSEPSGPL